jgi:hypothetical protein
MLGTIRPLTSPKFPFECRLQDGQPKAGGAVEVGGDQGFEFVPHAQPPLYFRRLHRPERSGDRQRKAQGKARPAGSQQQEGQLLNVFAIRQAVIAKDAAVVP